MQGHNTNRSETFRRRLTWLGVGVLLVVVSLPRLLNLAHFMMWDEYIWVVRSRDFALALLDGDLAGTFRKAHPGVTTMWLGSLGYWFYSHFVTGTSLGETLAAMNQCNFTKDLLPFLRLPVVVVVLACVAVAAKMVQKLFNGWLALIALMLLAFDPFLSGHARLIHHDALVAVFMLVSSLSIVVYAFRKRWYPYVLLSGVSAGLAILSRMTAIYLIPFTGLLILLVAGREIGWPLSRHKYKVAWPIILAGVGWLALVCLTFYDFWPAMWVAPFQTVGKMFTMASDYTENPHTQGLFFLGRAVDDPGMAYYGLFIPFRMTPVALIGFLIAVGYWVKEVVWKGRYDVELLTIGVMLFYAVSFVVFISIGAKKQGRYILPTTLMMDVIAAWGLYRLIGWVKSRWKKINRWDAGVYALGLGLITVGQMAVCLPHHPYYLTYYNPLLGGGRSASQLITVGLGEGLDEAARYLNTKPNVQDVQAAMWLTTPFSPFYKGRTVYSSRDKGFALASDYTVLYLAELQLGYPDPELHAAVQRLGTLEKVIEVRGTDYAWIYRMPPAIKPVLYESGLTNVLAYQVTPAQVQPGGVVSVTTYIRGNGWVDALNVQMVDQTGYVGFEMQVDIPRVVEESGQVIGIEEVIQQYEVPASLTSGVYCPRLDLPSGFDVELLLEPDPNITARCGQYQAPPGKGCLVVGDTASGNVN